MSLEPAPDNLDDAEGALGLLVHLILWVVFHLPVPLDLIGVGAPVLATSLVATVGQTEKTYTTSQCFSRGLSRL